MDSRARRPWLRGAALASVLALAVGACGGGTSVDEPATGGAPPATDGDPVAGGTATATFLVDVTRNYDPAYVIGAAGNDGWNTQLLFDTLVRVTEDTGEVVPRLVESVEASEDQTRWTLRVRPDVVFSDGTPFDAEAIKFHWDRILDPATGSSCAQAAVIESSTVVDELTLEATLAQPNSAFPYILQGCVGMVGSPTAITELGEDFGQRPVAAGPYLLEEWVPGDHTTFVRNPDYWDAPRPYIDEIEFQVITDAQQRVNALDTGQVDWLTYAFYDSTWETVASNDDYALALGGLNGGFGLVLNTMQPPFDNFSARQAVLHAIDPEQANQVITGGEGLTADTWFVESSQFHDPALAQPHDGLEVAQQHVDDYVAETGGPLEFTISGAGVLSDMTEAFQQQIARLDDVDVSVDIVDGPEALRQQTELDYQAQTGGPRSGEQSSPVLQLFTSFRNPPANYYDVEEVNAALDELMATPRDDEQTQQRLMSQIVQEAVIDDPAFITVFQALKGSFYRPERIRGVTLYNGGIPDWANMWIEE